MTDKKPSGVGDVARIVKKLTLPDGFRVGIKNLDNILQEVANLNLTDTKTVKTELLERVKECNYVAPSAETDYAVALFKEYQQKFEPDKFKKETTERHQHTKG